MNIENIALLGGMLKNLGFDEGLSFDILKQASFMPLSITVRHQINKGNDVISFQIYFERKGENYHFKYYDAALRKAFELNDPAAALDKKMDAINWQSAFSQSERRQWSAADTSSWKTEAMVAAIIKELEALGDAEDVVKLKIKHWGDIEQSIFNLAPFKSKFEITQRFYFFEEQGCIGAEEAYRFLHNKWLEKQMVARRKAESSVDAENETASGSGRLLQKKRGGSKKKSGLI